jgi:hypothetical protein
MQKCVSFLLVLLLLCQSIFALDCQKSSTFLAPRTIIPIAKESKINSDFWRQYFQTRWKNVLGIVGGTAVLSGITNSSLIEIFVPNLTYALRIKAFIAVLGTTGLYYQSMKEKQILKKKDLHAPQEAKNRLELKAQRPTIFFTRLLNYIWLTQCLRGFALQAMGVTFGTHTIIPWIAFVWIIMLIVSSHYFVKNKNHRLTDSVALRRILLAFLAIASLLTFASNLELFGMIPKNGGVSFSYVATLTLLDMTVYTPPYFALSFLSVQFFQWFWSSPEHRLSWKELFKKIQTYFLGHPKSEKHATKHSDFMLKVWSFWLISVPIAYALFFIFDGILLFVMFSVVEMILSVLHSFWLSPEARPLQKDPTKHFEAFPLVEKHRAVNPETESKARVTTRKPISGITVRTAQNKLLFEMVPHELQELAKAFNLKNVKEVSRLIDLALDQLQNWGIDIDRLTQKKILLALLDKSASEHLFEDHAKNGFIGINRALLDVAKMNATVGYILFVVGLAHELRHEAGISEENLSGDADFTCILLKSAGLNLETFSAVLKQHFTTRAFLDIVTQRVKVSLNPSVSVSQDTLSLSGLLLPNSREFTVSDNAPVPVEVAFANHAFEHGLSDKIARRIVAVVSRQNMKGAIETGRSLVIPLPQTAWLTVRGKTWKAIRLKAVTHQGQPPKSEAFMPDLFTRDYVSQPTHRFSVDPFGTFHVDLVSKHPKGGAFLHEALNEYHTMTHAFQSGVLTAYPIGVGRFTKLSFEGQSLGFVIMAHEEKQQGFQHERISFQSPSSSENAEQIALWEKFVQQFEAAGRTLRKLHENGITHTHPHSGQFDFQAGNEAYVYDFTNAVTIQKMSRDEFFFRVLSDFGSFYVEMCLTESSGVQGLEFIAKAQKARLLRTSLEAFVDGYFNDQELSILRKTVLHEIKQMISITDKTLNEQNIIHFCKTYLLNSASKKKFIKYFLMETWRLQAFSGKPIRDLVDWITADYPLTKLFMFSTDIIYDRLMPGESRASIDHSHPSLKDFCRRHYDVQQAA